MSVSSPAFERCQITGEELPVDHIVEFMNLHVGPAGKVMLIDRLRAGLPPPGAIVVPASSTKTAARLIDLMIVSAAATVVGIVFEEAVGVGWSIAMAGVGVGYYAVFTTLGRTPGQRIMKIRIEKFGGEEKVLPLAAIARAFLVLSPVLFFLALLDAISSHFIEYLGFPLLGLDFLAWIWMLVDVFSESGHPLSRALHDRLTGTIVVTDEPEFPMIRLTAEARDNPPGSFEYLCAECGAANSAPLVPPNETGAVAQFASCASCGLDTKIYAFEAIPIGPDTPEPAVHGEAVCAVHPNSRAIEVCSGSGDYCCRLCYINLYDKPYSIGYLDRGGRDLAMGAFAGEVPVWFGRRSETWLLVVWVLLLLVTMPLVLVFVLAVRFTQNRAARAWLKKYVPPELHNAAMKADGRIFDAQRTPLRSLFLAPAYAVHSRGTSTSTRRVRRIGFAEVDMLLVHTKKIWKSYTLLGTFALLVGGLILADSPGTDAGHFFATLFFIAAAVSYSLVLLRPMRVFRFYRSNQIYTVEGFLSESKTARLGMHMADAIAKHQDETRRAAKAVEPIVEAELAQPAVEPTPADAGEEPERGPEEPGAVNA